MYFISLALSFLSIIVHWWEFFIDFEEEYDPKNSMTSAEIEHYQSIISTVVWMKEIIEILSLLTGILLYKKTHKKKH